MSKLFKDEKNHLSDGWVPSSLVPHILALRHRKYELYAPMKMQTEKLPVDKGTNVTPIQKFFEVKKETSFHCFLSFGFGPDIFY